MKSSIVTFLFCFYTLGCLAQVHKGFRWIGPDHYLYSINHETGLLFKESPQKLKTELGFIVDWNVLKKDLPGDFDICTFYLKDSLLITVPGTGLLYNLNLSEKKLKRLDQTFFRGYNFNATQFIRKDTLFSVGGEGFWQRHSIITFYNPSTHEWDLYDSKNRNQSPSTNKFSGYSKKYDAFFSAYLETDSALKNRDIYLNTFSFKTQTWEIKGKLTKDLLEFSKVRCSSVWTGEYLILFPEDGRGNGYIRIVNPFTNELYSFYVSNNHFFMANSEITFSKGYLYSRNTTSAGRSDKFFFDSLSVDSIVKKSRKIGKAYETGYNWGIYFLTSLSLFIAFGGLMVYRNRKLKSSELKLSDSEWAVVKLLLESSKENRISSTELNSILQLNQKSYDNQRQIRNRIIVTINQKLYSSFGAKDLILRSSNSEDKRMMDYYINPEIKPKDLEFLLMKK